MGFSHPFSFGAYMAVFGVGGSTNEYMCVCVYACGQGMEKVAATRAQTLKDQRVATLSMVAVKR